MLPSSDRTIPSRHKAVQLHLYMLPPIRPSGGVMHLKSLFTAAVVLTAAVATLSFNVPARAQHARDAEMIGYHQLCERGDRKACIRFGMMLGENRVRHAEWRRLHPEWWGWER
jgi:hypothetical protein